MINANRPSCDYALLSGWSNLRQGKTTNPQVQYVAETGWMDGWMDERTNEDNK